MLVEHPWTWIVVNNGIEHNRRKGSQAHRPDTYINPWGPSAAYRSCPWCSIPRRTSLSEILHRNYRNSDCCFSDCHAPAEQQAKTLKKLPPATFSISVSEYPRRLISSNILEKHEASSIPSGVTTIPSKSEPRPT